jgi:hypothetical protein
LGAIERSDTMRLMMLAAACATALAPSVCLSSELYDQFVAARSLFVVDPSDTSEFYANYARRLMQGIEGKWFPIGVLQVDSDEEQADVYAKACELNAFAVSVKSDYTLVFDRQVKNGTVTTIYTSRGGSAFGVYTDAEQLFEWLGFTDDLIKSNPMIAFSPLSNTNGIATIMRPSPDVLTIETNYGAPVIFGRCPG